MKLVPSPQMIRSLANVSRGTVVRGCLRSQVHRTLVTSAPRLVTASSDKKVGQVSPDPVDAFRSSPIGTFQSSSTGTFENSSTGTALTSLSEEEMALKEAAGRLAKEKIEPLVKSMDQTGVMDPSVIQALFHSGVRCFYTISLVSVLRYVFYVFLCIFTYFTYCYVFYVLSKDSYRMTFEGRSEKKLRLELNMSERGKESFYKLRTL